MSTALPLAVRGRLVSDGAAVLEQTRTRVAELRTAPTRHNELATARERYQQAVVERDGLVRDLETIPDEHREPLVSVESRRAQIQRGRDDALAARTAAAAATEVARAGVRAYEGLRDAASGALVAERRARRLADLLGRNRLMARLLAQALRDLQRIANEMLAHTSGGQLELRLSLVAHSGEEHVEIQAIDHGSVERPMEVAFISGGQKFRVAVALAAAIGQYTGASAAGRSLIVDEGFGSLDEEGRAQMIAELQAAAPLMDRIVVVSHHEDFSSRELFPSAFLVEKGPNGTTARRVV
jgi:DNA repair exonuclease SbcCD ATPase subunit